MAARPSPRPRVIGPLLALSLAASPPAVAFGPGVHMREAAVVLDRLAADAPTWGADATSPLALAYLGLGSISPDFMFMADALGFGHALDLSRHLLADAATRDPAHRLFALGHLCHIASDGSSEAFTVPAFFSSAPLGAFDLIADQGPHREAEGIVESLGDFMTGDWHAVVDTLYDLWLDGPAARARFASVFAWYCTTASTYLGVPTDCSLAATQIGDTLDEVASLLGGFSRDEAHVFIDGLLAAGPDALVDLVASGAVGGLTGTATYETGPEAERELARVRSSALMDPAFWALYDTSLAGLGPAFAADFFAGHYSGWPAYNENAIRSGTITSHLRFLPEDFAVRTGFMVDELRWETLEGSPVAAVDAALAGAPLVARVRFFSALPLAAVVRAAVKRDLAGIATAADPVLGDAEVAVDIDPHAYAVVTRHTLTVPFAATPGDGLGFYLELTVGDDPLPAFTTNWDRIWTIGSLDFDRAMYAEDYGTYGRWPPSLPIAAPTAQTGALFAKAVRYPAGSGIPGATVTLDGGAPSSVTSSAGAALWPDLAPGPHTVHVAAPGFAPAEAVTVDLPNLGTAWARVALHAIPAVTTPAPFTSAPACLPYQIDRAPFGDQIAGFRVEARAAAGGQVLAGPVDVGKVAQGELCFATALADGTALRAVARARYIDDTLGVEGAGPVVTVDTSAPELTSLAIAAAGSACVPTDAAVPWLPATTLTVGARDPRSGVVGASLTLARGSATETAEAAPAAPAPEAALDLTVPAGPYPDGASLIIRVTNGAGLVQERAVTPTELPRLGEAERCPTEEDTGPATEDATSPVPDAGAGDAAADGDTVARPIRRDDGCATGTGADALLLVASALAALRRRRRRLTELARIQ